MPFLKVYIHFVWSTKNREPLLTKEIRKKVFIHIRKNSIENGVFVDFINGYNDHVHCLVSLSNIQTLADAMKIVKGESANWINNNNLCENKFEWQDEYYAVSVSPAMLDTVRDYIKNQEVHHHKQSFADEMKDLFEKYGFKKLND